MSELDPVPPEAFDVERPKAPEPTGYRDAAPDVPERFGVATAASGGVRSRARTSTGLFVLLGVVVLLGAVLAMCGQHRRDLDRQQQLHRERR